MIKSNLNTISKLNPMSFISSNHWVLTIYKIFKIINLSTQFYEMNKQQDKDPREAKNQIRLFLSNH